jgi:DNA-binding transcriptional ArsR family regulator
VSYEWISGAFLKANIPLDWLSRACRLSGKSLATALAIWYLKGLQNSSENLRLTSAVVERFGVSRFSKSRALRYLEKAGLIKVERQLRKNPLVTILKVDEGVNSPAQMTGDD